MLGYKNVQHSRFPRLKVEILSIGQNVDKLWPVDVLLYMPKEGKYP